MCQIGSPFFSPRQDRCFRYGFMLKYQGPRIGVVSKNLLSADRLQAQLEDKICKEIREGRVMGPFSHPPMPNIHIYPIGLVLKSSGGWRMITHSSYPPPQGIIFFYRSKYMFSQIYCF